MVAASFIVDHKSIVHIGYIKQGKQWIVIVTSISPDLEPCVFWVSSEMKIAIKEPDFIIYNEPI